MLGRPSHIFEPRPSEISAAAAPYASDSYLPDNLDITVFSGGHESATDFAALRPHLDNADVFVAEVTAWDMDQIGILSRISQGDRSARKQLEREYARGEFNPFTKQSMRALLGSELRVTSIDYPATDERADEILAHFDNWSIFKHVVPSFEETLNRIAGFAEVEAELEQHREDIMARSIGPRLET